MHKLTLTLLLCTTVAGCAQEVIKVHDSSIAAQFAQFNKNGWQVASNDTSKKTQTASNDPNVRIVKEADWSGMHFNTNFQVDDPKLRAQMEHQNQQNPQNQPPPTPAAQTGMNPFGPALVTPGH